jgi:hypothetical protein
MKPCPDWTALVAHRFERGGEEPPGWRELLEHAETCADCRRAALAADPTLVFARLAEEDSAVVDIAAMRRAVETLRRAQETSPGRARHRRAGARWRLAAAAVLPLLAVLLPAAPRPERAPVPVVQVSPPATPAPPFAELAALPLVEDLGRPQARVYELGGPDLAVVMIVDETLDV